MIQRVVSNTGPLIHLAQIDKLEILRLFHEILVSEEVYLEAIKEGKSGGEKIKNVNNVIVKRLNEDGNKKNPTIKPTIIPIIDPLELFLKLFLRL